MTRALDIVFAWPEIPEYGARLVHEATRMPGLAVDVVSTRGPLPISGIDEILGQPVRWIRRDDRLLTWERLGRPVPDVLVVGGWSTPAFNSLRVDARARGAKVVMMVDNPWKGTLRQRAGTLWFRLRRRNSFDGIWVPGKAGAKFAAALGFPTERIETGLYAADPDLFRGAMPLAERPRMFLFVGQLIERKGLRVLAEALRSGRGGQLPEIDAFGTGPLAGELASVPGLRLHGFLPSNVIAFELARSRFLVLPSLEDHWPLVVHEAVSSGCGIVTTDGVGSRHELVSFNNGWIYPRKSAAGLSACLAEAASAPLSRLVAIEGASRRLALPYSPARWTERLRGLLSRIGVSLPADAPR